MIPWIQVYSNILTHDKTYKLAEELKIPNYSAVGLMVSLWCWVAINAPTGDITDYPPRAISEATGWSKKPNTFYEVLVDTGLIEKTEDGRTVIRNWENYATLLIDLMDSQKKKTAARVQKHRDKKKQREQAARGETSPPDTGEPDVKRDCNVTETPSNALPNLTQPNPTIPNHSSYEESNNSFVVDDGGACARAEKISNDFLHQRDLSMSEYFGANEAVQSEARAITSMIFKSFGLRQPTEQDAMMVFRHVANHAQTEQGWQITFPEESVKLLMYGFEQAGKVGSPGNWNYIDGCMARIHQRGITTLEQAEDYDFEREERL